MKTSSINLAVNKKQKMQVAILEGKDCYLVLRTYPSIEFKTELIFSTKELHLAKREYVKAKRAYKMRSVK